VSQTLSADTFNAKVNALKPGGTIGIVAPASSVKESLLKGRLSAKVRLQVLPESVLARHYYFAGL
jgi:hypothetical protein